MNIKNLENLLCANAWIATANIFVDKSDKLNISIIQKVPVVRIFDHDLTQNYLDENANIIPLHLQNNNEVPIVTNSGNIIKFNDIGIKKSVVAVANFIAQDSFWNYMITQININNKKEIELVPLMADQTILIGDTTNLADKFNRLFQFYKEAIPKLGWQKYDMINVKYTGQIIASNSLIPIAIDSSNTNIKIN
jgi:cell division protein FtsQ